MNKFEFKNLTPFKWFVLENFPFIEADFDALTEWQLFCKLGKEINKIIDSQNIVGEQAETLTNAFNNLKNYVDNYFNNLDVQTEINNKLNEMAESGQLTEIIAQYLQLAGVLAYNTLNDLKQATNIVNGSICKTLGNINYNDGKGSFYKIRQITSKDVVDEENIISLNISNTLIGEKINNLDIINLKNYNSKMLVIGDSWSAYNSQYFQNPNNLWCRVVAKALKLKLNLHSLGGAGYTVGTKTFVDLVNEAIASIDDIDSYKYVFIFGGTNDLYLNSTSTMLADVVTAITNIVTEIKNKFTNGVHIIIIGPNTREKLKYNSTNKCCDTDLQSYIAYACDINGVTYIDGIPFMLNKATYFTDNHPNDIGQKIVASNVLSCLNGNGMLNYFTTSVNYDLTGNSNVKSAIMTSKIYKDKIMFSVTFQTSATGEQDISLNLNPLTKVPSQYIPVCKQSDRTIITGGQVTGNAFACHINSSSTTESYKFTFEMPV